MLPPLLPNTAPPEDGVAPAAVPLATATVFKPQHFSLSYTPREGTVHLAAATNVGKTVVNWHTPTVGIEPIAPPPSHSAVRRTNYCTTTPFRKKNGLGIAYIMRHLPQHRSLARCYHRCYQTLLFLSLLYYYYYYYYY